MKQESIKEILPHRAPFLFINEVEDYSIASQELFARFDVDGDFFFFKGHFPDNPILPGVILTEALAQACGLNLAFMEANKLCQTNEFDELEKYITKHPFEDKPSLALVENSIRFLRPVFPNNSLSLKTKLIKARNERFQYYVTAYDGKYIYCRGKLILALIQL